MVVKQLVTAEQFWDMPDIPGTRLELVHGEVIAVPGTGLQHARLVRRLLFLLSDFVTPRVLGEVFADGLSYLIAQMPDTVRIPDVSFIAAARIPEEGFQGFVPFAPDLAIEIMSPNDREAEIRDKARQYLAAGTRQVWVLRPETRSASIFLRDGAASDVGAEGQIDGGNVLPGFSISMNQIFGDAH